jgi:glycosyltransferase involved in cell wall biosynthesis
VNVFKNPIWVADQLLDYSSVDEIPQSLYNQINQGLNLLGQDKTPEVSIVIPIWNEELNIVQTLLSISQNITTYPTEVIAVNNNSTDRTQEVLNKFKIKSFVQTIQGCGPARQLGQEKASGKFILTADADCFYPKLWIQTLAEKLQEDRVSCVYGRHSFIARTKSQRFGFFIYETLRDVLIELRHFKRPYLNSLGMTMGYKREYGLTAGFDPRNVRGEDGRFCFDMMRFGRIVKASRSARVWTQPRTLGKEESLFQSLLSRVAKELSRITEFFYKKSAHDTHTSENYSPPARRWFKKKGDSHLK